MNRWGILAVLFCARISMAFQFQSIAALSPLMIDSYALTLADIGLLIGLYVAPGVVVSVPGAALGVRFGEKRMVVIGMALMLSGSVLIAVAPEWPTLLAGRVLAGTGGVLLNVLMTKMVVDWFAGKEVATALSVFVNSWPVGIAVALLVLPSIADTGGLTTGWWTVAGFVGAMFVAFAALYRDPPVVAEAVATARLSKLPIYALFMASLVWALYNAALAMIFSFGPAVLIDKGWSLAAAGSAISLCMLSFCVAIPVGGWLSDRTGRRDLIIVVSLISFVPLMPLLPMAPDWAAIAILLIVGVLFALGAGPVMSLPALVLPPAVRTFGMGVFFVIYYVVMMISPRIAGGLADMTGGAAVTTQFGASLALGAVVALVLFNRARRTLPQMA